MLPAEIHVSVEDLFNLEEAIMEVQQLYNARHPELNQALLQLTRSWQQLRIKIRPATPEPTPPDPGKYLVKTKR